MLGLGNTGDGREELSAEHLPSYPNSAQPTYSNSEQNKAGLIKCQPNRLHRLFFSLHSQMASNRKEKVSFRIVMDTTNRRKRLWIDQVW